MDSFKRKSKKNKKQKNYLKTFDEHHDDFYSHHYGQDERDIHPVEVETTVWRPDFHHEMLEWPDHGHETRHDKFW